jgi:transcriptional regulatory protein LevR/transcriptional regulator with AAA-type ATPase domain
MKGIVLIGRNKFYIILNSANLLPGKYAFWTKNFRLLVLGYRRLFMKRIEQVYETVKGICEEQLRKYGQIRGASTDEIVEKLGIQRTNASSELNGLVKIGRLEKTEGKPVIYRTVGMNTKPDDNMDQPSALDGIIGAGRSLKTTIQQAKAAVMYPPLGLHTMLFGETGVGKSMFAEAMFRYARDIGRVKANAPFVAFNCADYAHNPQLLLAQLFGVKKGSFTGADVDKIGLVGKAHTGILFLDEVHRLPPEGQEMLFYLLDKGMYRSLGEVEEYKKVQVLILCATTENPDSTLLKTFVRRIPMIISLPALRERTMNERWELMKLFFRREAQCIKIPVSVSLNSLKAFLLYDCPNNIGQLKSDIKLSCARAFLEYVGNKDKGLRVCSEDLPGHVRRGMVKYKEYRGDIEAIGLAEDIIFSVTAEDVYLPKSMHMNIYKMLEEKIQTLKGKGLSEEDVQLIMSLDVDVCIKQYMSKFHRGNLEELYKIADKQVVDVVQQFLEYASEKIGRQFDDKILFGMSIHLSSALERMRENKPIINLHLSEIQKSHQLEYEVASECGGMLHEQFKLQVPPDEIGFITMFLVLDEYIQKKGPGRVGIIVAMHGTSTATSMAEVANRLLGEKHVVAYDMPLEQKPEVALEEIIRLVEQLDQGQGVLLLVDMGSLVIFGDMIHERTAVSIRTVEMVSTPLVLEAARKAIMLTPLDEIYRALSELSPFVSKVYWNNTEFSNKLKGDVIITACITGMGSAVKFKNIIEKMAKMQELEIDVIPLEISSVEDYNRKIAKIRQEKNLLAVVSSIRPGDSSVTYISPKRLLAGGVNILTMDRGPKEQANRVVEDVMDKMSFMQDVINQNLTVDGREFMQAFAKFYRVLVADNFRITEEGMIGLILHLACVVERLIKKEPIPNPKIEELNMELYGESYAIVVKAAQHIEQTFRLKLPQGEFLNVVKLIHM